MSAQEDKFDDTLVDLEHKTNAELREMIDALHEEENAVSYRRRILHGRIDILRAELVRRLKNQREAGADLISGKDIDRLIQILASDSRNLSLLTVDDPFEDAQDK